MKTTLKASKVHPTKNITGQGAAPADRGVAKGSNLPDHSFGRDGFPTRQNVGKGTSIKDGLYC